MKCKDEIITFNVGGNWSTRENTHVGTDPLTAVRNQPGGVNDLLITTLPRSLRSVNLDKIKLLLIKFESVTYVIRQNDSRNELNFSIHILKNL